MILARRVRWGGWGEHSGLAILMKLMRVVREVKMRSSASRDGSAYIAGRDILERGGGTYEDGKVEFGDWIWY